MFLPRCVSDRQNLSAQFGQFKRVIELAVGEQAGVRADLAAVKFQLQAAVEIDPKKRRFRFTHRVRHDRAHKIATKY